MSVERRAVRLPGTMQVLGRGWLSSNSIVFDEGSAIRFMVVEDRLFEYEAKEKKKKAGGPSDAAASSMFEGTWAYTIETPDP